jgi:hypothetical protein
MSTAPFTTRGVKYAMRLAVRHRPWPTVIAVDRELMDLLWLAFDESRTLLGDDVSPELFDPERSLRFLGVPLRLAGEHEQSREDGWSITVGAGTSAERLERVLVLRLADLAADIGAWEQRRSRQVDDDIKAVVVDQPPAAVSAWPELTTALVIATAAIGTRVYQFLWCSGLTEMQAFRYLWPAYAVAGAAMLAYIGWRLTEKGPRG